MNVAHLLRETITLKRRRSHSEAGDSTRKPSATMSARLERKVGVLISPSGTETTFDAVVYTVEALEPGDLVFFPEDSTTGVAAGRRVLQVKREVALDGSPGFFASYL